MGATTALTTWTIASADDVVLEDVLGTSTVGTGGVKDTPVTLTDEGAATELWDVIVAEEVVVAPSSPSPLKRVLTKSIAGSVVEDEDTEVPVSVVDKTAVDEA